MKKLVCLVLAMLMVLSVVPAFAAGTDGLEAAIVTAKSRVEIPAELSEFSSSMSTAQNGISTYRLTWSTPDGADSEKRVEVTIDSLGNIISYNKFDFANIYTNEVKLPKFSKDELETKAFAFFEQLNPELSQQFSSESEMSYGFGVGASTVTFYFSRYVNGLRFCGDRVSVAISAETGDVVQSYIDFLTYANDVQASDNVMTAEQAAEKFAELSPMKAQYFTRVSDDTNEAFLAYMPENASVMINAVTGEKFEPTSRYAYNGMVTYGAASETAAMAADDEGGFSFTEQEIANMDQIANLISIDELQKKAESMTEIYIEGAQLTNSSYTRVRKTGNDITEYIAVLIYDNGLDINFDAQTGELLHLSHYDSENDDSQKLTEAQCLEISKAFAEKYARDQYLKTDTDIDAKDEIDTENKRDNFWFNFDRIVNGYIYPSNSINISVDNRTGKVIYFDKNWSYDINFESPDGIISAEQAHNTLLSEKGIELQYVSDSTDGVKVNAVLIYGLARGNKPNLVSAKTGKLLNYSGDEYKGEKEVATADDIDGHYAEGQITALLNFGVITLPEGETGFRPDDVITQGEMLEFVTALEQHYYPMPLDTAELYRYAGRYGIIKPDEPQDSALPCIREEGVKFIIRALGNEDIAKMQGIFVTGFADSADITPGMEGYVALAKGYGIIGGNPDNTFAPKDSLTRADAAIMIYNYLSK